MSGGPVTAKKTAILPYTIDYVVNPRAPDLNLDGRCPIVPGLRKKRPLLHRVVLDIVGQIQIGGTGI